MLDQFYKMFLLISERDLYMIIALCSISAVFLREIIQSTLISVSVIPAFVVGSIVTLSLFRQNSILVQAGDDNQIVVASALGVTLSFLILAIIFDLILGLTDWRVRSMMKRRQKKDV
ncbi:MAG: hypothetical protein AAFR75_00695 [Pseudomonadota bacterium]